MRKVLIVILSVCCIACNAQKPKICAHRGFWDCDEAGHVENSIASLRQAQENGFWGSEFDVHLTADSIVVVNHDDRFHGIPIHTSTYKELLAKQHRNGEYIPTLDQYLDQGAKSKCMLVLEIKPQDTVERTLYLAQACRDALEAHNLLNPKRVMFISFSYDACKWVAQNLPGFDNQYLEGKVDPETLHADGINGLDYHFIAFHMHPDWVQRAHDLGMKVNVWTVDLAPEMRYLIKLGVDVITTNKPLTLKRVIVQQMARGKKALPLADPADFDGNLYTLKNNDITMQVTGFGARVVTLFTADREGRFADIVVGHNTLQEYITPPGERFLGATVGPVANRIGGASYTLDGTVWNTEPNDNVVNTLHGGFKGIDMVDWEVADRCDTAIVLKLNCPDGLAGFPGNREFTITYSISGADFTVDVTGTTDKATPVNITHHPFFCLSGEGTGSVEDYRLTVNASRFIPIDSKSIPTGEIALVEGTPFDFRTPHLVGERIGCDDEQLRNGNGYDHNWCLDKEGMGTACLLEDLMSGRTVEVITNKPGLQIYSGNFFTGAENGKNGKPLGFRSSIALEAQGWPDAVNHPNFPSIILQPGETYHSVTVYRFGVK